MEQKLINDVAEIVYRKKGGTDCTEEESATLKAFIRQHTENPDLKNEDAFNIAIELFPLEYDEVMGETEEERAYLRKSLTE